MIYINQNLAFLKVFVVLMLSLFGCDTGYKKNNGQWSYVVWNEGHGKRVLSLKADEATFTILEQKDYAKDKNNVFYKGRIIPEADPSSYVLLYGGHYAKDKNNVYLFYYPVVNANPETFSEIKFPYAKDNKTIFCGTIPMNVKDINKFQVIRPSSSYQVINKMEFIKQNPEYSYLDSIHVKAVVSGDGSAKTNFEYFESFKKVKG